LQSNPRRDIPSAGSSRWSRPGRGNPVAPRRARPRKFQPLLRRLRLRHKNSARASGGPAGGRRVGACLGRWRALSRRARAPVIFSRCYAACACGTKTRRGPPAALPGADVWGHAWGDGAHCRGVPRNFQPLLRRLCLRHKNSARASGGLAGGRRVGACLGRWCALSPALPVYRRRTIFEPQPFLSCRGYSTLQ